MREGQIIEAVYVINILSDVIMLVFLNYLNFLSHNCLNSPIVNIIVSRVTYIFHKMYVLRQSLI